MSEMTGQNTHAGLDGPVPSRCNLRPPWPPGQSGNPRGAKSGKVHGRARALAKLDELLDEEDTMSEVIDGLREYARRYPHQFFVKIVIPLLPKEAIVRSGPPEEVKIVWKPLSKNTPYNDPSTSEETRP
jgi:hypothetical protein